LITACGNTVREGYKTRSTLDKMKERLRVEWAKLNHIVSVIAVRSRSVMPVLYTFTCLYIKREQKNKVCLH